MGSPSAENHKSSIHLCSIPYSSDRSLRSNGLVLYETNFSSKSSSDRAIPSSDPYNFALTELREYECSIALNVSSACTFCGISVMLKHTKTRCAFFGLAKTLADGHSEVHIAGKFPGGDYVLTLYVDTVNNADLLGRTVAANGCTELSFDGQVVEYDMFRKKRADGPSFTQGIAVKASGPCQHSPRTWTCDGAMHSWGRFEDIYTLIGKPSHLRGNKVQEKCLHVHFIGDSLTRNLYYEFVSYETQHELVSMDFPRRMAFGCSTYQYHQALGFQPSYHQERETEEIDKEDPSTNQPPGSNNTATPPASLRPSQCLSYSDASLVKRETTRAAHLGYEILESLLQDIRHDPQAVLVIGLGMWHKVGYVLGSNDDLFLRNVQLLNATFRGPVIHLLTPSLTLGEGNSYDSSYRRMAEAERAKEVLSSSRYPNQRYLDAFTLSAGRLDRFYDRVHYFCDPNPKYKHTLADFPPTIAAALNEELRDNILGLKSFS